MTLVQDRVRTRPDVHARERDLSIARRLDPSQIAHQVLDRRAPRAPARCRDDAVRAGLVAARLNAEREGGASEGARRQDRLVRTTRSFRAGIPIRSRLRKFVLRDRDTKHPHQSRFVIVRHHTEDARQRGELVGTPRRVATSHHDSRSGVLTSDTPNRLPRALVGRGGDRAAVHHDDVRLLGRDEASAMRSQLRFDGQRVGLIDAATEGQEGVVHGRGIGFVFVFGFVFGFVFVFACVRVRISGSVDAFAAEDERESEDDDARRRQRLSECLPSNIAADVLVVECNPIDRIVRLGHCLAKLGSTADDGEDTTA